MPSRPKPPEKVITDSRHQFRAQHWRLIEEIEKHQSGRQMTRALYGIINKASRGPQSQEIIKRQVNAIDDLFERMTDRAINNLESRVFAGKNWNETYRRIRAFFWRTLPVPIKKEIIIQAIEQRKKDRAKIRS